MRRYWLLLLTVCSFIPAATVAREYGIPWGAWGRPFGVEWEFNIRHFPRYDFARFPCVIRDVPIHPDDVWEYHDNPYMAYPLPDAVLRAKGAGAIDLIGWWRVLPFAAIGGVYTMHLEGKDDPHRRYQLNQWGTGSRKRSASLRYYELDVQNFYQLGVGFELRTPWWPLSGRKWFRFAGGFIYDLTGTPITVKTGWDRGGGDEVFQEWNVATVKENRLQFSVALAWSLVPHFQSRYCAPPALAGFKVSWYQPFYELEWNAVGYGMWYQEYSIPQWQFSLALFL